jgi:putative inorganic carbon (HCO3(-)) transporter
MFWFDFNWQIQHFLNQFWWPINFLLLVILVILGYLSYKKPVQAVGLTIILLPTYLFRSRIWFLPVTFLELCIWVTFLGWLIKSIKEKKLKAGGKYYYQWPIILILLAATISIFISPNFHSAAGLWKAYFVEPILFFLVLINVIKSEQDKKIVLWALGISTLAISLLAIWQKFTGFGIAEPIWTDPAKRRVTSIFTSPNAVGLYLGPIIAIYLAWLIAEIKILKPTILKLLIIIPAILAVLFTVSQGTWLGLAAAVVFLVYFACPTKPKGWRRGWNKRITAATILAVIILLLIIPVSRNILWPTITFADASGQNRLALLQMSQKYLLSSAKNFVFGAGLLGFSEIQSQIRDPLKMEALLYSHNIIFNFWLEIGLLGLIAFIWLTIKFFKKGFQRLNNDWLKLGVMAAMITIIIHGLIDVPYFKNDLAILFWLIVSLL